MTTLVVVADEAGARILELPPKGGALRPVEELTDPDAHTDRADARDDPRGFARRLSQRLTELHQQRRYDSLHLVTAPRFLGTLRRELKPEVEKAVTASINKDLVHLGNDEHMRRVFSGPAVATP